MAVLFKSIKIGNNANVIMISCIVIVEMKYVNK